MAEISIWSAAIIVMLSDVRSIDWLRRGRNPGRSTVR